MFPHIIDKRDCPDTDAMLAWAAGASAAIKVYLAQSGAVLFRGLPVRTAEDFDAFSAAFGYDDFTYRESLSNAVRINHTPRVFTANEAPPEVEIFLHHEMAQTPVSPEKIFFCCIAAAETGGATPLCRSDELYAALAEAQPEWAAQFEAKGLKYTTRMPAEDDAGSGQGRSWRSTLSVDSVDAAEAKLAKLGYSWQWQADDGSLLATTPVLPAVRVLPDGTKSFYNQLVATRGWSGPGASATFGDGSPISMDMMETIAELADQFTIDLDWRDGDVALVDNHRVMHGRRSYGGERKRVVLVSLARDGAGGS